MVMTQQDPIQTIASEQSRLGEEFQHLATSAWNAPSRCPGWSNAFVVAHIAFYARAYHQSIAKALSGEGGAPDGPNGRAVSRDEYLAWERQKNDAFADRAPDGLMNEFITSGEQLLGTLTRLAPTDLNLPAWHQSGIYTVGTLIAWRIYELGFHGWDVRATLDPMAEIRRELCPYMLGTLRQLQTFLSAPSPTTEVTCRFEVDGQAWTTRIRAGKLSEIPESSDVDALIRMDACTYLLLSTFRRSLTDCADRVTIEGSRDRGQQALSGIGLRI